MSLKWIKSRKVLVAVGILVIGWATVQSEAESLASGEFLTDRIGEGSVLRLVSQPVRELDRRIVFFQEGHPVSLAQLKSTEAYCRFSSTHEKLAEALQSRHELVVKFKNVARARWFFDRGIQLECFGAGGAEMRESEFESALGGTFQVEKRTELAQNEAL